ncbi:MULTISPECIES: hypothetical protein [unclassified Sphingomonas]|uniref:hypothetical protein n=1 Tax=unclassified Sphingomonas TaxID=196159 RepID=UPI000A9029AE|nr:MULTISPECIES: hypothetical protein [unclassified Sphingomonas]
MNNFVIRENIARFEKAITLENDIEKIMVLRTLLEREKAKIVPARSADQNFP